MGAVLTMIMSIIGKNDNDVLPQRGRLENDDDVMQTKGAQVKCGLHNQTRL